MYESYWQLTTKPFEATTDVEFYYPGETHQGAMLKLRYALESRRGAAVLSGAAGLGKTLVARALLQQLPDTFAPRLNVVFPQMPTEQLLAYIANELARRIEYPAGETPPACRTIDQSVQCIERCLTISADAGKHTILLVDEAHLIHEPAALETLRLLLNFEVDSRPALTLLLLGQPSLLGTLERSAEFDERIAVKCLLRRFSLEESICYVQHRLQAAGAHHAIFERDALEEIHRLAYGIPRRINRLCDLALLVGFADERTNLTATDISSVAEELVAVSA